MSGYWRDPLGIGEQIQIGDKIMLSLVLVLPEFFATGLPSGFGFAGGISIGNTTLKTAVEISEDPEDELVVGSVHDLSITDGEALISTFTGIELPKAPNFLVYKNADVYLSTGVYLGNVFYPAGFSFDADILFCGVQLRAAGGVSNGVLKLKGDLSNFQVGPLTVKGVNHPHAILDLECSAALQKAHVDGVINIFHFIDIAIWLDIQLMPSPLFRFAFLLHFTDLLTFSVHAELTKSIEDFKDLTQLDFSLVAYFEQHLLDYIRDHVIDQLKNAKKNADEAVGAATSALDNAKAAFEKEIENAQSKLDAAYASWQKHAKQVHDASQAVIDAYNVKCKQLQNSVEEQRAQFHAKLKHAETSLQVTNAARAAKLKAAEADVTRAKQAWDHDIDVAEKSLRDAQAEMDRKFGSVERDIDHAEARVDSLQSQINDIQNTINDYENAHWYEFW
ncbi:hypothetical protein SISSUDRAFT_987692 [Sistotremastrum suecicum HHB10207 ss-3]|uniref:Uncharacterized protein n=1 Tax=Sistotremastrum suecicum HHB10207 ss-3 TaxID=1314776 RepID=A0A166CH48_9AGAM|nr:hypothetical protein SISSUDRAFT_987692 [Sistotremastrum suecicum HHB10207 ss-3]